MMTLLTNYFAGQFACGTVEVDRDSAGGVMLTIQDKGEQITVVLEPGEAVELGKALFDAAIGAK